MATKKEILRDIRATAGNALSESQVAAYVGGHRGTVSQQLARDKVEYFRLTPKGKKTDLAIDIAGWIYNKSF